MSTRTNIELPDELLAEAMSLTGLKTKRAAVIRGLEELVRRAKQERARAYFGRLTWEGDLEEMRGGEEPASS